MPTYSLTQRSITFTSTAGQDILLPESFRGVEGLSQLFDFNLELLAETGAPIKPQSIVGTKVTVALQLSGTTQKRYINGLVAGLSRGASTSSFDAFTARIVPSLWLLTLNTNCRIFQNLSVLDILKKVFQQYSLSTRLDALGTYPTLDYCTQYHETDFQFVSRLMEQNGIYYFFIHSADDHTLVIADGRNSYASCIPNSDLQFVSAGSSPDIALNLLHDLSEHSTMIAGKHTRWDYDFRTFASIQTEPVLSSSGFGDQHTNERYDYPGAGAGINQASASANSLDTAQIKVSAVAEDVSSDIFRGSSNCPSLVPGFTFDVLQHPTAAWNRKYLLTQVTVTANQSPSYRAGGAAPSSDYDNTFVAISSDLLYYAPQTTPKPVIPGPQTAVVTGPSGEEIYLDEFGRIKVQFFWDRLGKKNDTSSAWLRVAQQWAGKAWGTYFWPRLGDEVIVAFLDGDPDHPIVTGSVYNGVNTPPYPLPADGTRSGVLTRSSKSGTAGNELRFEDKKGSEEIYIHAQKDQNVKIENDLGVTIGKDSATVIDGNENHHVVGNQMTAVDGARHVTVGGAHNETVTGAKSITVGGAQDESITGNYSLQTGGNHSHTVGQVYVVDSGQEVHIKGGMKVVIESGLELCLTGPGGFITIGPAGVAISGMLVMINSGGAQVTGTPATAPSPQSPTKPTDPTAPTGATGGTGSSSSPSGPPPTSTPPSSSGSSGGGSGGTGSSPGGSSPSAGPSSAIGAAVSTAGTTASSLASQAQSTVNQVQTAANAAVAQAQSAANAADATAQAAVQQAQTAAQQAQNAVAQAAQSAQQAAQQGSQYAQQTANQALQTAQGAAAQAQSALAQAQNAAAQTEQQGQNAVNQARSAAAQAEQQAQQAANQAVQQGQNAVNQLQQQAQSAAQQAQAQVQQAAQGAQNAAQAAAKQAQQAATQASQAAQNAQNAAKNAANAIKNPF